MNCNFFIKAAPEYFVSIKLLNCRNLPKADVIGKIDPYVKVLSLYDISMLLSILFSKSKVSKLILPFFSLIFNEKLLNQAPRKQIITPITTKILEAPNRCPLVRP